VDEIEFIDMLKEDPNRCQSCPVQELHETLHAQFVVTLVLFKGDCANRRELHKDISTVVMGGN
jgi:hypothetical protein